jgi:hypothetical protein
MPINHVSFWRYTLRTYVLKSLISYIAYLLNVSNYTYNTLHFNVHFWWKFLTRHSMYVWCNTEVRSCNHCCSRKGKSVTYSRSVFVALGIKHAMRMYHIIFCGLPDSTIFFHTVPYTVRCSWVVWIYILYIYIYILPKVFPLWNSGRVWVVKWSWELCRR